MNAKTSKRLAPVLALLIGGALGCGVGLPGGPQTVPPGPGRAPAPGGQTTISGEVSRVDASRQEIQIDTRYGTEAVQYDRSTRVVYQGQDYAPTAIEAGDVVSAQVSQGRSGAGYADYIEVTESVQDRRGYNGPNEPGYDGRNQPGYGQGSNDQLAGTVAWIDAQQGEFGLRTSRQGTLTVEMPYDAGRTDRQRFDRLRRGDPVRVEVEPHNEGQYRLVRFLS